MIRFLAMGALSLCAMVPAFAGSAALHSGKYEGLMLAVTPEHQVEGFYAEEMGEGVTRRYAEQAAAVIILQRLGLPT